MPPARRRPSAAVCALLTLAIGWLAAPSEELRADALERLNEPRLARVHAAVEAFEAARSLREPSRPYREYRVNLHVHVLESIFPGAPDLVFLWFLCTVSTFCNLNICVCLS